MQRSTLHTSSRSQVYLRGPLGDRSKIFNACEFFTLHVLFLVEICFFFLKLKENKEPCSRGEAS